jgi:hypothetical protein
MIGWLLAVLRRIPGRAPAAAATWDEALFEFEVADWAPSLWKDRWV